MSRKRKKKGGARPLHKDYVEVDRRNSGESAALGGVLCGKAYGDRAAPTTLLFSVPPGMHAFLVSLRDEDRSLGQSVDPPFF